MPSVLPDNVKLTNENGYDQDVNWSCLHESSSVWIDKIYITNFYLVELAVELLVIRRQSNIIETRVQ